MTDNEIIHSILEYVCSQKNQSAFSSDQIADALNLPLAKVNDGVRQIIKNRDAKGSSDKTTTRKGAVGLTKVLRTKDAFKTKKYMNDNMDDPRYNILIKTTSFAYNILDVPQQDLDKIIKAYLEEDDSFTLSGEKHPLSYLSTFKIFTYNSKVKFDDFQKFCKNKGWWKNSIMGPHYKTEALEYLGKDVTSEMIGNAAYGEAKKPDEIKNSSEFVNSSRLDGLRAINHSDFDLTKLIRLCEEINDNFSRGNYLSVGMIGRTIIDHVPPIFGFSSFNEVANNYDGHSFKKSMQHLNKSLRNIADSYLHQHIRDKETLPNATQVGFQQDLDRLLEEIIRILK